MTVVLLQTGLQLTGCLLGLKVPVRVWWMHTHSLPQWRSRSLWFLFASLLFFLGFFQNLLSVYLCQILQRFGFLGNCCATSFLLGTHKVVDGLIHASALNNYSCSAYKYWFPTFQRAWFQFRFIIISSKLKLSANLFEHCTGTSWNQQLKWPW